MELTLAVELREDKGKGASRRLRHAGKIPAIIYGADKEPVSIQIKQSTITNMAGKEEFFAHIITLDFGDKTEKVLVKDLQRHPYKPQVDHADFLRIDENKKLKANIPLHVIGQESCPGIGKGGLLAHDLIEIEINCLPKDLPEFIEVDISSLEIGDSVHMSDLKLPVGIELIEIIKGHDNTVVHIGRVRGGDAETEETEGEAEE